MLYSQPQAVMTKSRYEAGSMEEDHSEVATTKEKEGRQGIDYLTLR